MAAKGKSVCVLLLLVGCVWSRVKSNSQIRLPENLHLADVTGDQVLYLA